MTAGCAVLWTLQQVHMHTNQLGSLQHNFATNQVSSSCGCQVSVYRPVPYMMLTHMSTQGMSKSYCQEFACTCQVHATYTQLSLYYYTKNMGCIYLPCHGAKSHPSPGGQGHHSVPTILQLGARSIKTILFHSMLSMLASCSHSWGQVCSCKSEEASRLLSAAAAAGGFFCQAPRHRHDMMQSCHVHM